MKFLITAALSAAMAYGLAPVGASLLVRSNTPEAARFSGIGKFAGCTAFLIRPFGASVNSPAYAVTAGHCNDRSANSVLLDAADTSNRSVIFDYLIDKPDSERPRVRVKRIVYSTMKGTDIALLELDTTLGSLNVRPLELGAIPGVGEPVEWAGIPSTFIPSTDAFLRTSPCTLGERVDVVEWRWFWYGHLRNDCSDIFGGASGSPLISRTTGRVVGVIVTGNVLALETEGDYRCWLNNPCEVVKGGFEYKPDSSYAAPVAPLAPCFDGAGRFDLSQPGCALDPGIQARVQESRVVDKPGSSWNTSVTSGTLSLMRYKVIKEGSGNCRDGTGYGAPLPLGTISDRIPQEEGRYQLCIVAGTEGAWQSFQYPNIVVLRIDGTPPTRPPEFQLFRNTRGFSLMTGFDPPEVSGQVVKDDKSETSTCSERETYRRIITYPFNMDADVKRLCIIAVDAAGNESAPYEIELTKPSILPAGVIGAAGQYVGRVARGGWLTIQGVNFYQGIPVLVTDSAGTSHFIKPAYVSESQINLVLGDVAAGPASVQVGSATAKFTIEETLPGVFTPNGVRYGIAGALARLADGSTVFTYDCRQSCVFNPLRDPRELILFANGFGRDVHAFVSGVPAEIARVDSDTLRIIMPQDLHGFLPVTIRSGGVTSSPVFIWVSAVP